SLADSLTLPTTMDASAPAFWAMIRIGSSSARRTMSMPVFSSSSAPLTLSSAFWHHSSDTPPPGTMPSSTAARVACSASSTQLFGDHLARGDGRDVREQFLAPVAEARRLDRAHLQRATQLVDHQRRQRLPLDVLGDDEQRLARLRHLLEDRAQVLHGGALLFVHQDVGV